MNRTRDGKRNVVDKKKLLERKMIGVFLSYLVIQMTFNVDLKQPKEFPKFNQEVGA